MSIRPAALLILAVSSAIATSGCAERYSFTHVPLGPGDAATVRIGGDRPALEIRNAGPTPADLSVDRLAGPGFAPPALPIPPGGAWRAEMPGGGAARVLNRGPAEAALQLWTPGWTSLRIATSPAGGGPERVVVDEGE